MTNITPDSAPLVDVFPVLVYGKEQLFCDARQLHQLFETKRQFSNWIQERIKVYGFIGSLDYHIVSDNLKNCVTFINYKDILQLLDHLYYKKSNKQNLQPASSRNSKRGPISIDYIITLDMAKILAIADKSTIGRQIYNFLNEYERQNLKLQTELIKTSKEGYTLVKTDVIGDSMKILIWAAEMYEVITNLDLQISTLKEHFTDLLEECPHYQTYFRDITKNPELKLKIQEILKQ